MIPLDVVVPWWGVAAIAAVASFITGLMAALINVSNKGKEIKADDRRQWDLHKYETVSKFTSLCDSIANVTWSSDPKGQTSTYNEANQESVRLLLMSKRLGDRAENLLGATVRLSNAANQMERTNAENEKKTAFEALILETRKDIGRGA